MIVMGANTQFFINKTKKDEKQKQQMKTSILPIIHQPCDQKPISKEQRLLVSEFYCIHRGKGRWLE